MGAPPLCSLLFSTAWGKDGLWSESEMAALQAGQQQWGMEMSVPETSMIPTYFKTQYDILTCSKTNFSPFGTADISSIEDKVFSKGTNKGLNILDSPITMALHLPFSLFKCLLSFYLPGKLFMLQNCHLQKTCPLSQLI